MPIFAWASRRSGGLAMLAMLALYGWVLSKEYSASREHGGYRDDDQQQDGSWDDAPSHQEANGPSRMARLGTAAFAYYGLLLHILVFAFPLRACWAIWELTKNLKSVNTKRQRELKLPTTAAAAAVAANTAMANGDIDQSIGGFWAKMLSPPRPESAISLLSSSESSSALTSSSSLSVSTASTSSTSSDAGDLMFEGGGFGSAVEPSNEMDIIHAIVIPNYKEELDTLRETLDVLASHPQATVTYDVYLAMEQREANSEAKALMLTEEFATKFRSVHYTMHPPDLPGESAGKGSNLAWAARKLSERYAIACRKDVIVTGIDADSHLSTNYFELLSSMHVAHPATAATTLYSVPIIFDRNAHSVPAIVRVADILWGAAGLSGLYSTIAPPTSVYSVPLTLVDRVGGWDPDCEAIGEDLHMYLKCFFALQGHLTSRLILSPVSQSNVTGGDTSGSIRGVYLDLKARYKQALRHMWGALDTGYALRKLVEVWRERKRTSRAFRPLHKFLFAEGNYQVPDAVMVEGKESDKNGIFSNITQVELDAPNWLHILCLFHRLFEAHFLPVQMTITVIASTVYTWLQQGEDPQNLGWVFSVCGGLRAAGFLEIALYLALYEKFHAACLETRRREMKDAGLDKGMRFSDRRPRRNFIDYFMVPLVAPLYGAIPCAQAQICHFWTLDLVYAVSKKVTRRRSPSLMAEAKV